MKEKTKTILSIILIIGLVIIGFAYLKHQDNQMTRYAENNNCKWVYQGGFDICK